jgi:hypothetical protein
MKFRRLIEPPDAAQAVGVRQRPEKAVERVRPLPAFVQRISST